jgi:hypothetical protein
VLSSPVSAQRFQPVAGWHAQILQRFGSIEQVELSLRHPP